MSKRIDFKITVPHDESQDWHQWWFPINGFRGDGPTEQRDRAGRARGKRDGWLPEWFVLACNNPQCDARAVVPVSVVSDLADERDPFVPSTEGQR
jgi:hypothetical protein